MLMVAIILSVMANPLAALTQETPIPIASSPNPVGSGARALGMGGAFIGVADDATAASWNPGGLIQLETPEASLVLSYNNRREHTAYTSYPEADGSHGINTQEINYFSLAYPFTVWRKNMIVSLNFQHLYDFNEKVNYGFLMADSGPPVLSIDNRVDWDQDGALRSISPAFAVQLHPRLSLGATVNIWDKNFCNWESNFRSTGTGALGPFSFNEQIGIKEKFDFTGLNANIGFLWTINYTFSLGGVIKTPFRAELDRRYRYVSDRAFPLAPSADAHEVIEISDTQKLDMPMSYGIGLAVRFSDSLTCDLDIYRTQWDDYVRRTAGGEKLNPVTGEPAAISESDPATQVRFGGEYLFIGDRMVIPLRAGIFYDPEPAEGGPEDFYGISIGSGVAYKRFIFDMAYQYRFGRDVETTSFTVGGDDPEQDVDQHTVYMSVIWHWK
jgi:long-subunit fatty acid transport protein